MTAVWFVAGAVSAFVVVALALIVGACIAYGDELEPGECTCDDEDWLADQPTEVVRLDQHEIDARFRQITAPNSTRRWTA